MNQILIVEDRLNIAALYKKVLEEAGFCVDIAEDEKNAIRRISEDKPDMVLLDVSLTGDEKDQGGVKVLKFIRRQWNMKELPVVVISAFGDTSVMLKVMEAGANDYEVKPIVDFNGLITRMRRMIYRPVDNPEVENAQDEQCFPGKSKAIMHVTKFIMQAAHAHCDLLIMGEIGTGKRMAARLYCQLSKCDPKRFFVVNVLNMTPVLLDNAILAWTQSLPAKNGRKPKNREADNSIIFFDNLDESSPELQAKIWTLLDTGAFRHPVFKQTIQSKPILVASAKPHLPDLVKHGKFRADLYYQLLGNMITIPPLREHVEDIPCLVEHFFKKLNPKYGKNVKSLDADAMARFMEYSWPGNVRQLENCIEYGLLNCLDEHMTWNDVEGFFVNDVIPAQGTPLQNGPASTVVDVNPKREYSYKDIRLNPSKHEAKLADQKLDLRPTEYNLLLMFIKHVGYVLTRTQIMEYLQKDQAVIVQEKTINTHVKNLRERLGNYGHCIETVRNVGYRLAE